MNNSTTNNNGDASRAFAEHVKQTITNLPPVTKLLISLPILLLLLDVFTSSILQLFSISYWTVLDVDLILKHWQGDVTVVMTKSELLLWD